MRRLSEEKGGKLFLPQAITEKIVKEKAAEGDDEYWLQNTTPRKSDISNNDKSKHASEIEYRTKLDGKSASNVEGLHSMVDEQEMHANASQGPILGRDISQDGASRHATEIFGVNKSQSGIFDNAEGSKDLAATPRENNARTSALFSQVDGASGARLEGTEIDGIEDQKSAAFGDLSEMNANASQ